MLRPLCHVLSIHFMSLMSSHTISSLYSLSGYRGVSFRKILRGNRRLRSVLLTASFFIDLAVPLFPCLSCKLCVWLAFCLSVYDVCIPICLHVRLSSVPSSIHTSSITLSVYSAIWKLSYTLLFLCILIFTPLLHWLASLKMWWLRSLTVIFVITNSPAKLTSIIFVSSMKHHRTVPHYPTLHFTTLYYTSMF